VKEKVYRIVSEIHNADSRISDELNLYLKEDKVCNVSSVSEGVK